MLFLENTFKRLSSFFNSLAERCAVCPDCRRNRYTGTSCIVMRQTHECGTMGVAPHQP